MIAHTLTANGFDASEDGTGRGTPLVSFAPEVSGTVTSNGDAHSGFKDERGLVAFNETGHGWWGLGVRRLTPRECERLQGWPDDHTRYRADGSEIADGPRYRMIGNGVAAPCAEWIARRLMRFQMTKAA